MFRIRSVGVAASIMVAASTPLLMGALGRSDDFEGRILAVIISPYGLAVFG